MYIYNTQFLSFMRFLKNSVDVSVRKPLPSHEVEICRRMRLVREAARLSRPVFARFLGLDSSKLSNIEHFRVPLDYITGNAVCRIFRVSPRWLMTGRGRPTQVLPASVYAPIPEATARTLFSQAYPHLQKLAEHAERKISEQTQAIVHQLEARESQGHFDLSPAEFERSWQEAVLKTGASERAEIDAELATTVFGSPFTIEFENELAIVAEFDDKSLMRKVVAPSDLIDQVQSLTQQRGAKAKLARHLKVSRQRLNEWLSGRSKPSARYLLLLLNWTRTQQHRQRPRSEPQKKRAGSEKAQPAQRPKRKINK
jgi:transcriptional regulator with XRE-family HTH domain